MSDASKREITAISDSLPFQQFAEEVNKRLGQLEGIAKQFNHWPYEVDKIRSGLGLTQYYKTKKLGNTDSDYTDWTVHSTEDGYNIWKIPVSDYAYDADNALRIDHKVVDFMGEAITASGDTFDKIYIRSGSVILDYTSEASTPEGTPFNLMANTTEELLIGKSNIFSGADFSFFKPGYGYSLSYSYSKADGWGSGSTGTSIVREDNTSSLTRDGLMRINFPGDWASSDVNGQDLYWLRLKTTTVPRQVAKTYALEPSTNVANLLSLSSEQLLKTDVRKWCSFNNDIYTTIRNVGDLRYEGKLFLQSGSSSDNRKAFFVTNHFYEADYKNSGYSVKLPARNNLSFFDPCDTNLAGRYVNVGKDVAGTEGHVLIRDGYLTGIGITAGVAPDASITFVVNKNRQGTIISGTLASAGHSTQAGNFAPVLALAGDRVQVFAEPSSQTAMLDVVVDVEHIEVNVG